MLKFIETKFGPWPLGVIDPEVLKQWFDEEPLSDAYRQSIVYSIRGLTNEVARLQDMLLDAYYKQLEIKFGDLDIDDDKLIEVFNKVRDRVEFKDLDEIVEATTFEDLDEQINTDTNRKNNNKYQIRW